MSSAIIILIYSARSGTSIPASFSTASSQVVQSIGEWDILDIGFVLGKLFDSTMEVTEDGLHIDNDLAIECNPHPKDPMG